MKRSRHTLPLAANVKFTENGKAMALGDGLWRTAGAVKYTQSALDVELCSSGTHAVVRDGAHGCWVAGPSVPEGPVLVPGFAAD